MNEELKKLLEQLRGEMSTNHVDLEGRVKAIEERAKEPNADVKALRAELDEIKRVAGEREAAITELQRQQRVRMEAADPVRDRNRAVEIFGMQCREMLTRHLRIEMPQRFAGEAEQLRAYREQRATIEESTGSGAYFIPTVLSDKEIIDTLAAASQLVGKTDFLTGMPTKATIPTFTGRSTLQPKRASSDTDMTQSDKTFSQMDYNTEEAYIFFPVDNWLLALTPYALGAFLLPKLREAYIVGLADWLINADGTASYNSITGILNESTTTYITRMEGTKFEDLTNVDLRKAMRAVLPQFRVGGEWLLGPYAIDIMEEIKRDGQVPILREKSDGSYICKGRGIVEEEGMPDEGDSAANSAFIGFGSLKTFMVVMASNGIELATSTEVLFKRNQTCFRAMSHLDIKRKPLKSFTLLKTKSA